jgi:hypothetical protein
MVGLAFTAGSGPDSAGLAGGFIVGQAGGSGFPSAGLP